jgi:hypothetical protein
MNGLDDSVESAHGRFRAFPCLYAGFFSTDAGWRFLLVYSGNRTRFSVKDPRAFPARLYLFDEDARLLDRWELVPGEQQTVDLRGGDEAAAGIVELIPYPGATLPADAGLDLVVDGQRVRRFGASVSVDLRSGRLVAP